MEQEARFKTVLSCSGYGATTQRNLNKSQLFYNMLVSTSCCQLLAIVAP